MKLVKKEYKRKVERKLDSSNNRKMWPGMKIIIYITERAARLWKAMDK